MCDSLLLFLSLSLSLSLSALRCVLILRAAPRRAAGSFCSVIMVSRRRHVAFLSLRLFLASGATASSEGAQPVCRLPLAAFRPSTSGFSPRRPAAVIQYGRQGGKSRAPQPSRPFTGAGGHRSKKKEENASWYHNQHQRCRNPHNMMAQ